MLRPLTASDFDSVHTAFVDAFSDYVVRFEPTREQLREMLTRRGYVPELSAGVFDDGRLVAFTLNGVSDARGYDTGTGVIPSARRRGYGRQMLDFVRERLRDAGYTQYILEVIESNAAAIELYLAGGFQETRRLQCWSYEARREVTMPEIHLDEIPEWFDIEPSWQNSIASVRRARDRHVTIGNDDGYAIVFPNTGDLPRLVVRREARRRGVGSMLLDAAATIAGKPLRIMNVDLRDNGVDTFLERAGAKRTVRQIEMGLAL
jgi:ribosomal protein S18 acetylase RimI-like enzyme